MNRLLVVDLTKRNFNVEIIPDDILYNYLGGRGLGAYLLYTTLQKGVDPLSPDNVLIFSSGPAQGTNAYYSSRAVLHTKSPLTGIYLFSVASGSFGHQIKRSGYTSIMIKGRASAPTYLVIRNGDVEFRPAEHFWGMKTVEAHDSMLKDSQLPKGSCVCIGPSGEQLHMMAGIFTEGEKARTFGRGGSGAVMGSKNLKGIVIAGAQKVKIFDNETFQQAKNGIRESVKAKPKWVEERRLIGTGADMMAMNEIGILPTRNWKTGIFEKINSIALTEIQDIWPRKNVSCGPYCLNPCSHIANIDRGPWKGVRTEGPEYETIYVFGSDCFVDQFDAIVAAEEICDQYGIDTISCGATIAFAMECFEKGLISQEDTGGINLQFGNAEAMVKMVGMIARQEGLGALLSQGTRLAAEKIFGSSEFAMQCKGLEFGGYECRSMWGQALQFAINSRGGCHHGYGLPARSPVDLENGRKVVGKGNLVKNLAIDRILYDSAVMCTFPRGVVGIQNLALTVNAITGRNYSEDDIKQVGFRILTLERMFNVREGLRRKDDYLPERLLKEPLPDGPQRGSVVPMDELLDEGYDAFGWDKNTGIPLEETLASINLTDLCK
ncbi:MAG: aldehyde ferredoxin oxidoreductase family protein [Bacillota bacterium]|nr:aldehyde ferredoxin oxidoreductase family protein [Bacillota bacterium]